MDNSRGLQWDMVPIHAPEARAIEGGSFAVVVGDIDTGIDYTHPDHAPNVDFANSVSPRPLVGHFISVVGTARFEPARPDRFAIGKRYRSRPTRGVLLGKRHIREREPIVERHGRIGDWELDTVMGTVNERDCVLTFVERRSGFTLIRKLKARTADEVTAAATAEIGRRRACFQTLTFDNGTEFHDYETLERRFGITCYFATPYHSWERGSNENLNGLLRQYLPKGMSMRLLTQSDRNRIARQLNVRPRKRHGFKSPCEIFSQSSIVLHL